MREIIITFTTIRVYIFLGTSYSRVRVRAYVGVFFSYFSVPTLLLIHGDYVVATAVTTTATTTTQKTTVDCDRVHFTITMMIV